MSKEIFTQDLPANRTFGLFFGGLFLVGAVYLYFLGYLTASLSFACIALVLSALALLAPSYLLPLNRLWMAFGFFLGKIISPIVLGVIFYSLFAPLGILMRVFGRDELRIIARNRRTHWRERKEISTGPCSFTNQF